MSDKQIIFLIDQRRRDYAKQQIDMAGQDQVCVIQEKTRTLEQNALMWSLLAHLSKQVNWHGQYLTSDEWKCVMSASLKQQKVVPGIDSGFVVIGARTSKMGKKEMSDLCELIYAFGAGQGVRFEKDEQDKPKQLQQGIQIEGEFVKEYA